jgi:hypothetical protein
MERPKLLGDKLRQYRPQPTGDGAASFHREVVFAMRGDPTERREILAGLLLVALILALVAIALRDVL